MTSLLLYIGLTLGTAGGGGAVTEPAIDIRPARPLSCERRLELDRWHRRYRAQIDPLGPALEELLDRLARGDARGLTKPCRRFATAFLRIDRQAIFPVPDFAANHHLQRAIDSLHAAAIACLEFRPAALVYQLRRADEGFADADLSLERYGVPPSPETEGGVEAPPGAGSCRSPKPG